MQPSMAPADDANLRNAIDGLRGAPVRARSTTRVDFRAWRRIPVRKARDDSRCCDFGRGYACRGCGVGRRLAALWAMRTGRVELTTEGDPVVVQVLAEDSDTPIGEPFDLATRAVVELPDGDYRLRVNGRGRLGRTFRFAVNRGETLAHSVSIDEGTLLRAELAADGPDTEERRVRLVDREEYPKARRFSMSIPSAMVTAALELTAGKACLIELTGDTLVCRDV